MEASTGGVLLSDVRRGGPADKAGIKGHHQARGAALGRELVGERALVRRLLNQGRGDPDARGAGRLDSRRFMPSPFSSPGQKL
jgi:S1-C subfamily serine protease